jgi:uncharacterized protein YdeI (YjbR/CyaY-like superfamily)
MEITETFLAANRQDWREWLTVNHQAKTEIWLLLERKPAPTLTYLDAVEEALCFGWIDGIAKVQSPAYRAQRFSPRKAKSNWTELNKERCRRLIKLGLMTEAGLKTLPDLNEEFVIPTEVLADLKQDPTVWKQFNAFPDLYQRVRIGNLIEMYKYKKLDEYQIKLKNLLTQTAKGKMYGEWNDGGRLLNY